MQTGRLSLIAAAAALVFTQTAALAQTVYSGVTTNFGGGAYILGNGSSGNTLLVTNAAVFQNMSSVTIGSGAGGDDNAAVLTGTNSRWDNGGTVTVGSESGAAGNALTIKNSAVMNNAGALAMSGTEGTLHVSGSGKMNTGAGITIGNAAGANGNTVIVTGSGSVWNDTGGGGMTIANRGVIGNALIVSNGASVANLSEAGSVNGDNKIIVTGNGSYVRGSKSGKNFTLGGGHVIVTNGGAMDCGNTLWLYGGAITVSGANSEFRIAKELGWGGGNQTWTVTDGGYLGGFQWGDAGCSDNRFICSGVNSRISSFTGSATSGDFGFNGDKADVCNNSLMVSKGGAVWFGKDFSLGSLSGCTNNVVTITGSGSTWTQGWRRLGAVYTSSIHIGHISAYDNYLNVYDGGTVTVTNLFVDGSSNALNLGSGTGGMSRASIETSAVVLSGTGARLNIDHGMLSTRASGLLVSGSGIVSNAGPAYFSIPENRVCEISSVIAGPGNLTKEGDGTLTLSGANAYMGSTSVSNGTLVLKQALLNDASDVHVVSGSTLALDFIGDDWIGRLYWNNEAQPRGTYGAGDLGGAITGTGRLRVTDSSAAAGISVVVR